MTRRHALRLEDQTHKDEEGEFSPETRVARIERIWREEYDSVPERAIAEFLADVRHFCDSYGLAYHEIDRKAYGFYLAEVMGVPA